MIFESSGSNTAAAKTALNITSSATARPRVKYLKGSQIGTVSTDAQVEVQCSRTTTAGTGTSVTPGSSDSGDPAAAGISFLSALSAEPTYTSNSMCARLIFNPRGFAEWIPLREDQDILLPATASNGLGALINTLGGATTVVVETRVQN